jgi:hypothetical protein
MAKKIAREAKVGEELTLDSGVTVTVRPFPAGLFEKVQARALEDFPDPDPPMKEIPVVDGVEEVEDVDAPGYLAQKELAERKRLERLGEACLDLCVSVDLEAWEPTIRRLERYAGPFPEDPDERQLEFLTSYALSTADDWQNVLVTAIEQTVIGSPEVAERLKLFRRSVERPAAADADAPGADAVQRVELQPAAE